jgi:hypothetical protein
MITFYAFGAAFGLPDASPFVMKAEILLKMSGQPYQVNTKGLFKSPKGKCLTSMTMAPWWPIPPSSAGTWNDSTASTLTRA